MSRESFSNTRGPGDSEDKIHPASSPSTSTPNSKPPSLSLDPEKGSQTTPAPEPSQRNYSLWQWTTILIAIYSSQFLYGLDTTIVADIQGAIISDFNEIGRLGWLAIGYPLGSVATILTFGKAYGVFDLKWLYVGSMIMFTAGSALCGGAQVRELNFGNVSFGVGGVWLIWSRI
jgi:hypothetical protein